MIECRRCCPHVAPGGNIPEHQEEGGGTGEPTGQKGYGKDVRDGKCWAYIAYLWLLQGPSVYILEGKELDFHRGVYVL